MENECESELGLAVNEMRPVLRSTLKYLPDDLIADLAFKFEDLAGAAIRALLHVTVEELEGREPFESGEEDLFEYS